MSVKIEWVCDWCTLAVGMDRAGQPEGWTQLGLPGDFICPHCTKYWHDVKAKAQEVAKEECAKAGPQK